MKEKQKNIEKIELNSIIMPILLLGMLIYNLYKGQYVVVNYALMSVLFCHLSLESFKLFKTNRNIAYMIQVVAFSITTLCSLILFVRGA